MYGCCRSCRISYANSVVGLANVDKFEGVMRSITIKQILQGKNFQVPYLGKNMFENCGRVASGPSNRAGNTMRVDLCSRNYQPSGWSAEFCSLTASWVPRKEQINR